jgi:hypothetical protein
MGNDRVGMESIEGGKKVDRGMPRKGKRVRSSAFQRIRVILTAAFNRFVVRCSTSRFLHEHRFAVQSVAGRCLVRYEMGFAELSRFRCKDKLGGSSATWCPDEISRGKKVKSLFDNTIWHLLELQVSLLSYPAVSTSLEVGVACMHTYVDSYRESGGNCRYNVMHERSEGEAGGYHVSPVPRKEQIVSLAFPFRQFR